MTTLKGKTLFITGGSRGVGLAIGLGAARDGANICIAAKTVEPHSKLPGTIFTAAKEIEEAGGHALPLQVDIRDETQVYDAVEKTVGKFGGIDIVVNNASAISLTSTADTPIKRYDLMTAVNSRGTFAVTQACLPWLLQSDHAHILTISPPLDLSPRWFAGHAAYSLTKFGMSLLSLGWAEEFKGKIAVNCLWPRTTIDTAAVRNLLGGEPMANASRRPDIMGDAARVILEKGVEFTGWFCLDDLVLAAEGVVDFEQYAVTPGTPLQPDFFVPTSAPEPRDAGGRVGWRADEL